MNKKELEKIMKETAKKEITKTSKKPNLFDKLNEKREEFKATQVENKAKVEVKEEPVVEEIKPEEPVNENVVILQEPSERTEERFNKERSTRKTKSIKKEIK